MSLALSEADAQELGASMQAHFGDTDFAVAGVVDGNWVLRFPGPVDCVTHAPDAVVGRNVHDYMPTGRDGARIRSRRQRDPDAAARASGQRATRTRAASRP